MVPLGIRQGLLCALVIATASATAQRRSTTNLRSLQENSQTLIGYQSGPDPGATYGGSIIYRPDTKRIYVTGASYGNFFKSEGASTSTNSASVQPSCFLGVADVSVANNKGGSLSWTHSQKWDTSVPEACNGIYVDTNPYNLPENNTGIEEKVYLLGYTSTGGSLEQLRFQSTFPAKQYGMIMDVDVLKMEPGSKDVSTTFWGGRLLQDGPVQYPIDLTLDDDGNIYVASLQTYDSTVSTKTVSPDQVAKQMVNPWMKPYGSEYNMLIQQFLYDNPGYDDGIGLPTDPNNVQIDTTIVDNWRKPYGPMNGSGGALVAGIEYLGGLLVVVGSTNGHSPVFGNEISSNSNRTDSSWNGFVTKIIPDSGSYYQFVVDNGDPDSGAAHPLHKRSATSFMSIDFKDDYIMGMCSSPSDPDHFYIVGTTEGQMDRQFDLLVKGEVHAFLMKVDVWNLLPIWTKQLGGDPLKKDVVRGMTCAVTDDGKDIYMAGVVESGGSFSLYNQKSFGKDDIFIFQADTEDGNLEFLRQIGTSGNDRLAPGGLTVDESGNAILMGQTDGSFYRSRQFDQDSEKSDDLFIMTVMRGTGDYKAPQVSDSSTSTPTESDVNSLPSSTAEQVDNGSETVQEKPGVEEEEEEVEIPASNGKEPEVYTNGASIDSADFSKIKNEMNGDESTIPQDRQRYGLAIFCILVVIVGLITGLFAYRHFTEGDAETERSKVLEYLNDFDVDDIDLKQSATGGYHCSYTNDLAHGINAKAVSREGLFGPMGFDETRGTRADPLLARHPDSRSRGEIHFSDEPNGDDVSSIGSGIGTPGRHSTHSDAALLDDQSEATDVI